ncbi:MAG: tRNA pseudouridine(38-40) synthase TruA [Planctomycetota bacterium]|nr:tRNA pseudouridine(38-40) synthase TruA [Planctomycetota bacterium]
MRNLKLTLAYDGTNYSGWQVQPDRPSVQGTLRDAFSRLTGEQATINGAGRTDAGVHALGQVANLRTDTKLPIERLLLGLQHYLPDDVAIRDIVDVPFEFHATLSARRKTYRYVVRPSRLRDPFSRGFAWRISHELDVQAMGEAASHLVGTHDFKCFETQGSPRAETVRTLFQADVFRAPEWPVMSAAFEPQRDDRGSYVVVEVTGDGFLYNMVRAISGTLVEVGLGKRSPASVASLMSNGRRAAAGQTAPPHGLFLVRVDYQENGSITGRKK